jgi:hypothetical protein
MRRHKVGRVDLQPEAHSIHSALRAQTQFRADKYREFYNIVTCKSIARQRPQYTRGQQYWNNVFFVSAVTAHNSG